MLPFWGGIKVSGPEHEKKHWLRKIRAVTQMRSLLILFIIRPPFPGACGAFRKPLLQELGLSLRRAPEAVSGDSVGKKKAEVPALRFYAPAPMIVRGLFIALLPTPNALSPNRLAPHALAEKEHRDDEADVCYVEHLEPPFCFSP
jgi:hypothetical protein